MCSTPRSSARVRKIHRFSSNVSNYKSYSQMMNRASKMYERKLQQRDQEQLQEQLKQKKELLLEPLKSPVIIDNELLKLSSTALLKKRLSQIVLFLRAKIPPIVIH
ncbi:MAG: hypothetical protein QM479_05685 [Pseudomonadota bacterium]